MGSEQRTLIHTDRSVDKDPAFAPFKDLFKGRDRVRFGVPAQRQMGPEHFHGEFYILYQVSQEDNDGEQFDMRVFFREVNGLKVANWIGGFNKYFCQKVLNPIIPHSPMLHISHQTAVRVKNQLDFLVLGIPGRYIEEVLDSYFRLLKSRI
jgi:hypothetical protein